MRAIDSLLIIGVIITSFCCQEAQVNCSRVTSYQRAKYSGYILYYNYSQDGIRDVWFFPSCGIPEKSKSDTSIFSSSLDTGILFKIPITDPLYSSFSQNAKELLVDDVRERSTIYCSAVVIELDKPENNTSQFSTKGDDYWLFEINRAKEHKKVNYFISLNPHIISIKRHY